jgi:hypothetical protein
MFELIFGFLPMETWPMEFQNGGIFAWYAPSTSSPEAREVPDR